MSYSSHAQVLSVFDGGRLELYGKNVTTRWLKLTADAVSHGGLMPAAYSHLVWVVECAVPATWLNEGKPQFKHASPPALFDNWRASASKALSPSA